MMNFHKMITEMAHKAKSDQFYKNKAGVWGYNNPNAKVNHSANKRKK